MTSLPQEIIDLAEMKPMEDLILPLLRNKITSVPVQSLIQEDQTFPFVMVRTDGDWGAWDGDPRFIDTAQLEVNVFCFGLNADEDAAILSDAVRVALNRSLNEVVPGWGHLTSVRMVQRGTRKADWSTAVGPVQYADLPTGTIRYEGLFDISARRATS